MQLDSFAVMGETVSFILWLFWSIWHSYFRKSRIVLFLSHGYKRSLALWWASILRERNQPTPLKRKRKKNTTNGRGKKKQAVAISSMRKLSSFVQSLRQTWCQAGSTAPVCPASSFSFLCSFRSTEFGPWRLKQGTLLRKTHHHQRRDNLKWWLGFSLSD